MPRGVPASGKRQPRAVGPAKSAAETPVAGSALDQFDRIDTSAADEIPEADLPVDLTPAPPDEKALVDDEMTPEQQEIKALRDQIARLSGSKDVEPVVEEVQEPGDQRNILIHFLGDGLTALGRIWYRGDELEFEVGSQAYRDTFDRRGKTWLDLRDNDFAQVERFGTVMFRSGPWPGKSYSDGNFEILRVERGEGRIAPPSEQELAAAEKRRKQRSAPRLPSLSQA